MQINQSESANESKPEHQTRHSSRVKKIVLPLFAVLVVGVLGGVLYMTTACPCDNVPGLYLFGDSPDGPVDDWSFVNDVPLCTLQIYAGWRPHSINLNCMATPAGDLYVSCSVCDTKYWASEVEANESGRLRLNGVVYPVALNRITDPAQLDAAWASRVQKLQVHGGGPYNPVPPPDAIRNDRWWTFRVTSRS